MQRDKNSQDDLEEEKELKDLHYQMAKLIKLQHLSQYGINTNFCQLKHKGTQICQ